MAALHPSQCSLIPDSAPDYVTESSQFVRAAILRRSLARNYWFPARFANSASNGYPLLFKVKIHFNAPGKILGAAGIAAWLHPGLRLSSLQVVKDRFADETRLWMSVRCKTPAAI